MWILFISPKIIISNHNRWKFLRKTHSWYKMKYIINDEDLNGWFSERTVFVHSGICLSTWRLRTRYILVFSFDPSKHWLLSSKRTLCMSLLSIGCTLFWLTNSWHWRMRLRRLMRHQMSPATQATNTTKTTQPTTTHTIISVVLLLESTSLPHSVCSRSERNRAAGWRLVKETRAAVGGWALEIKWCRIQAFSELKTALWNGDQSLAMNMSKFNRKQEILVDAFCLIAYNEIYYVNSGLYGNQGMITILSICSIISK